MEKTCDHTSVGMLVWKDEKLLLIERNKFPFGYSPPSGHLDGDSYEEGAKRELKEEVGLDAINLKLILNERIDNQCRRVDGTWHEWEVFEVEAKGEIKASPYETKSAAFYDLEFIKKLSNKTKDYLAGKINEEDWKKDPGLEPVYLNFLEELKVL